MSEVNLDCQREIKLIKLPDREKVPIIVTFDEGADKVVARIWANQLPGEQYQAISEKIEVGVVAQCKLELKANGQYSDYWITQWGEPFSKQKGGNRGGGGGGGGKWQPSGKSAEEIRSMAAISVVKSVLEGAPIGQVDFHTTKKAIEDLLAIHDRFVYSHASMIAPAPTVATPAPPQPSKPTANTQQPTSSNGHTRTRSAPPQGNGTTSDRVAPAQTDPPRKAFGHVPEKWPEPQAFFEDPTANKMATLTKEFKSYEFQDHEIAPFRKAVFDAFGFKDWNSKAHASLLIDFLMSAGDKSVNDAVKAAEITA